MARIHELFVNGTTAITLAELIRKSIEPIQAARPAGVNIELDLDGDSVKLADDRAVTLAMVLHELCFNALRHGVREHGTIIIQSRISEQHGVTIHVIDDGGGAVSQIDKTSHAGGIGLSLVRGLVGRELHGEFRIGPRPGTGTIATIEMNGARGNYL
jgi:two-component sensor histidine kinase